jgi:hypothetical protein
MHSTSLLDGLIHLDVCLETLKIKIILFGNIWSEKLILFSKPLNRPLIPVTIILEQKINFFITEFLTFHFLPLTNQSQH